MKNYAFLDLSLLANLENYALAARYLCEGMIGGAHKSAYIGYNAEFSHHREYLPGDELRHIDWKRYAKTDKFFIKQYEESSSLNAMILLDDSNSMAVPTNKGLKKNTYAKILAASLAYLLLKQRDGLGFTRFSDNISDFLPISSKMTRFNEVCQILDKGESSGKTDLVKVLDELMPFLKKKCLFIIISDFLDKEAAIQEAILKIAYYGHEILAFHTLTFAELNFPYKEFSQFYDLESSHTVNMEASIAKLEYQKNLRQFLLEVEGFLKKQNADYLLLNTSYPLEQALTHFLYKRARYL